MLCPECKKEIEENCAFCSECGSPIPKDSGDEEKGDAEALTVDDTVEAEAAKENKRKRLSRKALAVMIAAFAALAAVGIILAAVFWGSLFGEGKKKADTDKQNADKAPIEEEAEEEEEEKEPEYKIMKATREASEKIIDDIYPALSALFSDGASLEGTLTASFDKTALKILGYDLPEKLSVSYCLNACEGAVEVKLSASIKNKDPFVNARIAFDIIEGTVYVECEELLGGTYFIPLPLPRISDLGIDAEREDICRVLSENIPEKDVLSELLAKYITVCADALGENIVTDDRSEITVQKITQMGLCKNEISINEESIKALLAGVKKAVSLDSLLRECAVDICCAIAKETMGEKKAPSKEELEENWRAKVKEYRENDETDLLLAALLGSRETKITFWTDAYYDLVAFLAEGSSRIHLAKAKYDTDAAFELSFKGEETDISLKGKGEMDNSLFEGKVKVYEGKDKLFEMKLWDFDFSNPINGKASYKAAKLAEIKLSAKTENGSGKCTLNLNAMGYKPVKVVLTLNAGKGKEIALPEDARGIVRFINVISNLTAEDVEKLVTDAGFDLAELERLVDDVKKLLG